MQGGVYVRKTGGSGSRSARGVLQDGPSAALSDDAKVILGGWFGLGLTEVSFAMREGRPTARTQAAIDECVKAGVLFREPFKEKGFRLKPCHDCKPYEKWLSRNRSKADFPLMEDIQ